MTVLPIEDFTIKIRPTLKLKEFVQTNFEVFEDSPENIVKLKNISGANFEDCILLINDIKWLNKKLIEYRKLSNDKVYLNELLKETNIILPQLKIVPRNPELDARVKKLLLQEKERQYAAMTKNVDAVRKFHPEDTIAYQMKQMNKQLIAVAQFIFSVITGFAFGFIGIELIIGNLDFGFRLLLGIMFALIVALAEIYFLAKKLNEDYIYETSTMEVSAKIHQD